MKNETRIVPSIVGLAGRPEAAAQPEHPVVAHRVAERQLAVLRRDYCPIDSGFVHQPQQDVRVSRSVPGVQYAPTPP